MKKITFILLLLSSIVANAQIFTQNADDGSITITPKGLQGNTNNGINYTNVALGTSALSSLTTGSSNVAIGSFSLAFNTTGHENTANGHYALNSNTTGFFNTANGTYVLRFNTEGYGNTANGYNALYANTTGNLNTANGFNSLSTNTSGHFNTATGSYALSSNLTGQYNVANGYNALYLNGDGYANTATGNAALYNNRMGFENTATGDGALHENFNGSNNTATGAGSLYANTTGYDNTAVGLYSLQFNTIGHSNTAIGREAGFTITTGSSNTFLGFNAISSGDYNNATALGANANVNASNKVRIGNNQVTVIEGQVAWSNPSDRRLKENIFVNNKLGLDFITRLQPMSYNYIADKSKTRYDGFIAQDIEQVMKEMGVEFSGLKKSEDGMYSLAYSDFVMPLVNAMKELKNENDALKKASKIDNIELNKQNEALRLIVKKVAAIEELLSYGQK